jgi:hypothetical protein
VSRLRDSKISPRIREIARIAKIANIAKSNEILIFNFGNSGDFGNFLIRVYPRQGFAFPISAILAILAILAIFVQPRPFRIPLLISL